MQPRQCLAQLLRGTGLHKSGGTVFREITKVILQDTQLIALQLAVGTVGIGDIYGAIGDGLVGLTMLNARGRLLQVVALGQTRPAVFAL